MGGAFMPKRHCGDRRCKGTCQHCYHINEDLQKARGRSNRGSSRGRFDTQDDNSNAWTGVSAGHDNRSGKDISEFLVSDKDAKEHHHFGIDDEGNEVFNNPPKQD